MTNPCDLSYIVGMPASNLTEKVEARVDADTKAALVKLANNSARSEGSIVRLALRDYLRKEGRKP